MRLAWLALLALAACQSQQPPATPPASPLPADGHIRVVAIPVPLNPDDPSQSRVGELTYAGGVELTSPDTSRLHGISGIDVDVVGHFIANTDEGDFIQGEVKLDGAGRLVGIENVSIQPLRDERGAALQGKAEGDAEDISFWGPDGGDGFAVSFERDHRILFYEHPGAAGKPIYRPTGAVWQAHSSPNEGLEALTSHCGVELAGNEQGQIGFLDDEPWRGAHAEPPPAGFSLTGMDMGGCTDLFAVYRAFDPIRGARAIVSFLPYPECSAMHLAPPPCLVRERHDLAELKRPLSVDNMEGITVTPMVGKWRIYLMSDDNFSSHERTLLLAFDWIPPKGTRP